MIGILMQINMGTTAVTADTTTALTNTVTAATQAAQQPITEESFSLMSMIMNGGLMMIPLAFILLLAIYIMVERLLVIGRASKKSPNLLNNIKDAIHKGNIDSAKNLCASINTPEAVMLEKGLSRIGQPVNDIREAM